MGLYIATLKRDGDWWIGWSKKIRRQRPGAVPRRVASKPPRDFGLGAQIQLE
jgi:hypothetical protein